METKKTKIFGFFEGDDIFEPDCYAYAISECGKILVEHECEHEKDAARWLGMGEGSFFHHTLYNQTFPDGWECEYVKMEDRDTHEGLGIALANIPLDRAFEIICPVY